MITTHRHRLIVRHPTRAGVIGVDVSAADTLPRVETRDSHTADVGELNAAIESRYGIKVTVLRSLAHGPVCDGFVERSHEIEVHGGLERCSLDWRCTETLTLDAADRAVVATWRVPVSRIDGRDWMLPGWFDAASAWIAKELGEGSSIRQIRTWASSCVLEITTGQSMQYFKALPASGVGEHAVTRFLGKTFPDSVPPVIAFDTDRRWLLLGACAGRNLETVDDIDLWARAARRYGELQVACMSRIDDLQRAGCPRRDIESLPRVAERCAALRACGIPDSLEHGDLWPANVFVDAHDSVIIDWEDAAIAHPFLSIAPLFVGLDDAGLASKANVEYLKREYLRAFESIAPAEELRRALSLAAPLSFLDLAARFKTQRPSVVRLHPWMRDLEAIPSPEGRGWCEAPGEGCRESSLHPSPGPAVSLMSHPLPSGEGNFIPQGISEPFRGFYQQKERTMKTGRDATFSGLYVSECCQKQRHIQEGQMLPRCPLCLNLTVWEIQKPATGDRNEKDHAYPCIV